MRKRTSNFGLLDTRTLSVGVSRAAELIELQNESRAADFGSFGQDHQQAKPGQDHGTAMWFPRRSISYPILHQPRPACIKCLARDGSAGSCTVCAVRVRRCVSSPADAVVLFLVYLTWS